MKNQTLTLSLLLCLFFAAFAGADLASGTFAGMDRPILPTPAYIRENGEVEDASNAIERNGDVYFLTSDFNGTLEIQKDDIVLYGNGYKFNRPPDVENGDF